MGKELRARPQFLNFSGRITICQSLKRILKTKSYAMCQKGREERSFLDVSNYLKMRSDRTKFARSYPVIVTFKHGSQQPILMKPSRQKPMFASHCHLQTW